MGMVPLRSFTHRKWRPCCDAHSHTGNGDHVVKPVKAGHLWPGRTNTAYCGMILQQINVYNYRKLGSKLTDKCAAKMLAGPTSQAGIRGSVGEHIVLSFLQLIVSNELQSAFFTQP